MYIEVNTTHHITSQESLKAEVAEMVEHDIARFADQVTHVEVHLDDENSHKGGEDDIRCTIEARVSGRQSLAVTAHAVNVIQAARGAAAKLTRALETAIGKQVAKQRAGGGKGQTLDDEGLSEA
jgi:hypothetical protein